MKEYIVFCVSSMYGAAVTSLFLKLLEWMIYLSVEASALALDFRGIHFCGASVIDCSVHSWALQAAKSHVI